MPTNTQRQPRFLWTGLMILGPVLALGAVALWQLRQDRAGAMSEAQREANDQLEEFLPYAKAFSTGGSIGVDGSLHAFLDSENLQLRSPLLFPKIPIPSERPSPESDELNALLDDRTSPPGERAVALAELSEKGGLTPGGLSVKQLALHNAIQIGGNANVERRQLRDWARSLYQDAIWKHPSAMTQRFLSAAAPYYEPIFDDEREQWEMHQEFRNFYAKNGAAFQRLVATYQGEAARDPELEMTGWIGSSPTYYYIVYGEIQVSLYPVDGLTSMSEEMAELIVPLPPNRGVRISLDGRLIHEKNVTADSEVLAAGANSDAKIYAEIFVTNPAELLEPVKMRSQRTALLIALAVLAAGIGWFAAYRAFVRQQQLAAMKDNFVSAVSHELKAPIASIGLMAEELREGSDKREEYTRLIAGECSRLGSLVDNVLDYARIESGTEAFAFEEADIGELVRAAAGLLDPPAAERGIEIEVEAPPAGELCATVDARALGRALVNLLDNAIKYAPADRPVSVVAEGDTITVTDTGEPIPPGEREQIFERFVRSGSELTRETKGVGIGLSLVRHIAEAHGGKAWVESTRTGNQFSISFGTPATTE